MHESARICGKHFASVYCKNQEGKEFVVVDLGSLNVNGCLREYFESMGVKYIGIDMVAGKNVDIVVNPGDPLPFVDGEVDAVISTSCFEHDPFFWMTFREMARITKKDGFIYVNAPSNGVYHRHPGDNWRFYHDAGQALAVWSGKVFDGKSYPMKVEEVFFARCAGNASSAVWLDFVCIWRRTDVPEEQIVLSKPDGKSAGPLCNAVKLDGATVMDYPYNPGKHTV